ncbi:MAG: biotin transporter BioY [Firmicutes bacterium]|nr:biotin transporter BioY [Bacillota bacterium]
MIGSVPYFPLAGALAQPGTNLRGGVFIKLKSLIVAGLFAGIISLLAQISIPLSFSPVPVTGQTLGVFLAGAVLGSRPGALSVLVYVLLGACGLPVFAQGRAGAGVLVGPTGGYLVGFVAGAYLCGRILEKRSQAGYLTVAGAMLVCLAVTYGAGVLWLAASLHLSLKAALGTGVIPFLPPDLLKLALAVALAVPVRRSLRAAGLSPRAYSSPPPGG